MDRLHIKDNAPHQQTTWTASDFSLQESVHCLTPLKKIKQKISDSKENKW